MNENSRWMTVARGSKSVLHTRRNGLKNMIEERAEENDKVAVRMEKLVGSTFCKF